MIDSGAVELADRDAPLVVRKSGRPLRIAYLVTHPIQYQAPMLRLLNAQPNIELTALFQSDLSVSAYHDPGFGRSVRWDVPLLEGYSYEFLPALGARNRVDGIWPLSYGIASRILSGRFDALWVHGFSRWANWVAMAVAIVRGIPILVRDEANEVSAHRSRAKIWLKRLFFSVLGRVVDVFLAIGTLNARYYLRNGVDPKKIVTMPYCVDNEYFAGLADAATQGRDGFRRALGLDPARPVILFASKFLPRKRAGDLLAGYLKLIARDAVTPKPYLLFVGDGAEFDSIQARAGAYAADVRFLGFRNQSELPAFFDLCDVFVLPSDSEPWGLVVNEVMSAARAVIVSDQVGCAPDLVQDGINGHVFPTGDVDALADALENVLRSREGAEEMGRASARIIAKWSFKEDIEGFQAGLARIDETRGLYRRENA